MDTREYIKEIARRLFAQHGYDGISIRDIIEKANVNLGAITYHFGGKEELFRELIMEMAKILSKELKKIDEVQTTPTRKLELFIESYMNLLLRNPSKSRMILMQMVIGDKRFLEIIKPFAEKNLGLLQKVLVEGMRNGEFQKKDPQLTAFSIFGVCAHFITVQPMIFRFIKKNKYDDIFINNAIEHTKKLVLNSLLKGKGK